MTTYRIVTTVDATDVKTTQRWYEEWKYNAKTGEYYIIEDAVEGFYKVATGLSEAEAMQWMKDIYNKADNEWLNPDMGEAVLSMNGRVLWYDLCETTAMDEECAIECGYLLNGEL